MNSEKHKPYEIALIGAIAIILAALIEKSYITYDIRAEFIFYALALALFIWLWVLLIHSRPVRSDGYLEECCHAENFLKACKESSNGIFLNVKVDFKNWFDPILQSHLAYQDVAIRHKQLESLKGFDIYGNPFPPDSKHWSNSMGSPLKRVIFLTEDEYDKAFKPRYPTIYSERLALQRCHWAMGIPLAFLTAEDLVEVFTRKGKLDLNAYCETVFENFILQFEDKDSKKNEPNKLWEALGFNPEIFCILKGVLSSGNAISAPEKKRAIKLFDKDILAMRKASRVGSDRIVATVDCAVLTVENQHQLWGAAFLKDRKVSRCRYYRIEEKSLSEFLDENRVKRIDFEFKGRDDQFELVKESKELSDYRKAIVAFSELIEKVAFIPISSALHDDGKLTGGYNAQEKFNPAIEVAIKAINDPKASSKNLQYFGNEFVCLNRKPKE